ncbi:putative GOLD domain-containing protein [Helianthus annuus]|nr:putative GOLD domain-containing protein [Helianthus annuus]
MLDESTTECQILCVGCREQEMQQLNSKTNSRMALLSFLSLFVCLSVAGLQVWHLKSFFEKKKLI